MSGKDKSNQDKKMASMLKAQGVQRKDSTATLPAMEARLKKAVKAGKTK